MCFGGGGSVNTGPQYTVQQWTNDDGSGGAAYTEVGVPLEYAQRGATTVAQYQQMAAQDLSDKQIQAQQQIAAQQADFNARQFGAQQDQYVQQQAQTQQQANYQSQYDAGRAKALNDATAQISDAFAKFSPDYFNQYRSDYMAKATDPIDYQAKEAGKQLQFALARQGLSSSQAGVNQQGVLDETRGRAIASATTDANNAVDALQNNVANARNNLQNQVAAAQSVGSPIAGSTIDDVNSALQTQRNAISGISNTAGDVVSSLQAVPQVNSLSNIFSNVLGTGGALLGGIQSGQVASNFNAGLSGTNPSGTSARFG